MCTTLIGFDLFFESVIVLSYCIYLNSILSHATIDRDAFNLESHPHDLIVMLVKKKIPLTINLSQPERLSAQYRSFMTMRCEFQLYI